MAKTVKIRIPAGTRCRDLAAAFTYGVTQAEVVVDATPVPAENAYYAEIAGARYSVPAPACTIVRPRRDRTKGKGLAGLIEWRRNRHTGTEVAIWHSREAGWDDDGGARPYTVTCEEHKTTLGCETLAGAKGGARYPDWCEECQPKLPKPRLAE